MRGVYDSDIIRIMSPSSWPEPIMLRGKVTSLHGNASMSARILLDSGAGANYLLVPDDYGGLSQPDSPFHTCPGLGGSVSLADGTKRGIQATVETKLSIYPHESGAYGACAWEGVVRLFVITVSLPDAATGNCLILAGRDFQSHCGVEVKGSQFAAINGICIYRASPRGQLKTAPPNYVSFEADNVSATEIITPSIGIPGICPQPTCAADEDGFSLELRAELSERVKDILIALCEEGWHPLEKCPSDSLCIRLRHLAPVEVRDTVQQSFTFEIDCSSFKSHQVPPSRNYSKALYDRLSPDLQERFSSLIGEYVDRNWWTPWSKELPLARLPCSVSPVIPVFLVGPSVQRKPRLVLDCRPVNQGFPATSSEAPDAYLVIACLRCVSPPMISTADAKQAFYRIRLTNLVLLLGAASLLYVSLRMCFGLCFGPTGLLSSLGRLVKSISVIFEACVWSLFVDDFVIGGNVDEVYTNLAVLFCAMYLCGFGVQRDKLKCIISESALNRLLPSQSALRDILHESIQVLGVAFKYIGDILRLQCRNQERLQRVHEFVISDKALNASKKDIYSVCGLLGFDPARLHPEARAVADALRALIGKRFSRDDWNCPLDFVSEFSAKQFQTYIALLSWARELASQPDCVHDSPCISQGIEYSLVLASDASRSGGGFVISKSARGGGPNNEAVPLCSDAFRWSASQRLYHSNRRELMALLAGLRVLANVLEHLFAHHRGGSDSCRLPTGVVILSDNRACVAWAAEDAVSLFGQKKAIEKRALGRLVLALAEELKLIRRRVPVNVSHIKGSLNAEADRLSRLFDRTLRGGISIGDSLVGQENPDAPSWPTDDDHDDLMYLEVDDPEFNHYDEVTGDDLTPYDIIDRVRLFASCTIENSSLNVRADVISVIDPPGTSPLIDHISRDSYDSVSVYNTVKAMRFIFRLLHTHSRGDGALQQLSYPYVPDSSDIRAVVHALQFRDPECAKIRGGRGSSCGPYVCDGDGLVVFRSGTPFGTEVFQFVLPAGCGPFRRKVLLDGHRQSCHQGIRPSLSYITDFFLPRSTRDMRDLISHCLICRTLRSQRSLSRLPGTRSEAARLSGLPAYYRVAVDYFSVGSKKKLLSAMCCFTRHVFFFPVAAENAYEALRALKILQLRTGGVREIVTDRASYFASPSLFQEEAARLLNAHVELTSSRSPWELGSEKLHDIAADRLRVFLRHSSGRWPDDAYREQELLEEVMLILNTRPLGTYYVSEKGADVITPDSLYFGYTRRRGCLYSHPASDAVPSFAPTRIRAFRNCFISWLWSELKKKSVESATSKCASSSHETVTLRPGDSVLVHMSGRKLGMTFRLGHVVRCLSDRRVRVRFPSGLLTTENTYNVVLLVPHPQVEDSVPSVSRIGNANTRLQENLDPHANLA